MHSHYLKLEDLEDFNQIFSVEYKKGENILTLDDLDFICYCLKEKVKINGYKLSNSPIFISLIGNEVEKFYYINNTLTSKKIECFNKFYKTTLNLKELQPRKQYILEYISNPVSPFEFEETLLFLDNDSSKNIFVRILFNSHLLIEGNPLGYYNRKNKLKNNLLKLFNLGNKRYLSKYEKVYEYLKEVLNEVNIDKRKEKMNEIFKEYFYNNELETPYRMNESFDITNLKILDLLGTVEEKFEYLKAIIETKKIDDDLIEKIIFSKCLLKMQSNNELIKIILTNNIFSLQKDLVIHFIEQELKFLNQEFNISLFYDKKVEIKVNISSLYEKIKEIKNMFRLISELDSLSGLLENTEKLFEKLNEIDITPIKRSSHSHFSDDKEHDSNDTFNYYKDLSEKDILAYLGESISNGSMNIFEANNFWIKIINYKKLSRRKNEK